MKILSEADVKKMKVTELKAALKERGLPQSGKKDELVKILMKNINISEEEDADMNLVNSVVDADVIKSPKLPTHEFTEVELSVSANGQQVIPDIPSNKTLNFEEEKPVISGTDCVEIEPISQNTIIINSETKASKIEDSAEESTVIVDAIIPEPLARIEDVVVSVSQLETVMNVVEATSIDVISEQPNLKIPEATGSEITALWSSTTVEDEEDDEQKELREVEEKKLREDVKKSMVNQAVKRGIVTVEKSKLTTSASLTTTTSTFSLTNSTNTSIPTSSNISNTSSITTVSYSNSTPHSDKSTPPPPRTTSAATTSTPTSSTATSTNPISRHLRIDYFQRPLNVTSLSKWLEEQSGINIPVDNIWLNSIKTHCYIDFANEVDAALCRTAIKDLQFPVGNPLRLKAEYTNVSAKEAPESAEAKLPPGQWMKTTVPTSSSSSTDTTQNRRIEVVTEKIVTSDEISVVPLPVPVEGALVTSPRLLTGKRKINNDAVMMNMLRNAAASAANSAIRTDNMVNIAGNEDIGFSTKKYRDGSSTNNTAISTGVGSGGGGGATSTATATGSNRVVGGPVKRNRESDSQEEAFRPEKTRRPQAEQIPVISNSSESIGNKVNDTNNEKKEEEEEEVKVISLETLFRKTASTPHLFWLPVSDEEVARRIKLRAL